MKVAARRWIRLPPLSAYPGLQKSRKFLVRATPAIYMNTRTAAKKAVPRMVFVEPRLRAIVPRTMYAISASTLAVSQSSPADIANSRLPAPLHWQAGRYRPHGVPFSPSVVAASATRRTSRLPAAKRKRRSSRAAHVYLFKEKVIHGADVSEFSTKVLHPDGKTAARPERNGSRDHETAMRALVPGNACKLSTRQIRCKPNAYLRAAMSVISISDSAGSGRIPSPHSRRPFRSSASGRSTRSAPRLPQSAFLLAAALFRFCAWLYAHRPLPARPSNGLWPSYCHHRILRSTCGGAV